MMVVVGQYKVMRSRVAFPFTYKQRLLSPSTMPSLSSAIAPPVTLTPHWCLLIDHNCKPTFGEPFPVNMYPGQTVHEIKKKIRAVDELPDIKVATNKIEVWRCKKLKLFANASFSLIKNQLCNLKFSDDEDSDVQHLGAAQMMMELELESREILLVLVPQDGTRYHSLPPCHLLSFPGRNLRTRS